MSQGQITLETAIEASEKKEISIEKAVQSNSSYMLMKHAGMFSASAIKAQQAKQLYLGLPVSAECEVFETDSLVMKNSLGKPNLLKVLVGPGEFGQYYCKISKGEIYPEDLLAVHQYLLDKRKEDLRPDLHKKMSALLKFRFSQAYKFDIFSDVLAKLFAFKDIDKAMIAFEKIILAYENQDDKIFLFNLHKKNQEKYYKDASDAFKIALVFYGLKEFDYISFLKELEFSEVFITNVSSYLDISKIRKANIKTLNYEQRFFHDVIKLWEGFSWEKYREIIQKAIYKKDFYFEIDSKNDLDFVETRVSLLNLKLSNTIYKTDYSKEHFFYSSLANFQNELDILYKKIADYKTKQVKISEEEAKVIQADPEEEEASF